MPPISFDLHKLGWKAFEDLVICILKEVMGQTFQSFSEGADGGCDGAFYGKWFPKDGECMSGTFTLQCKHTSLPVKSFPKSIIDEELPKISLLATQGMVDNYIMITNYKISARKAKEMENKFIAAGANNAKVYGARWIEMIISEYPSLRRLVPRLYGLGDLTQIVTHQAYRQAREVLDSLVPDLACFVPTLAYRQCAHALQEHGFVLLIGEPASGKTMIANLLALSAADEWDLQTIMLSSPEEFSHYWNPDDPGQFLWVDDAFGANQYDRNRVREWNQRFQKLKTAIHKGARVVFTSRDYIYNSAKNDIKISSFDLINNSQVVINVEVISEEERQMIIYNHLKNGKQKADFRKAVKPFLEDAASTTKFYPEIARRFANPSFTKQLYPRYNSVKSFFEEPQLWLEDIISNLSASDKTAIALVFISGGKLPIPLPEEEVIFRTISNMSANIGDVKSALFSLDGSMLRCSKDKNGNYWQFRHPTIRDAFASIVGSNPEYIDIYMAGVSTEQMMREVTCGDIGLQGAKIIIPPYLYEDVILRLKKINRGPCYCDPLGEFLAYRCSGDFLKLYYCDKEDMAILPQNIDMLFNDDLRILQRLHSEGLLPEDIRKETYLQISSLSLDNYSSEFMNNILVRSLLTSEEISSQWDELKDQVLSNQYEIISEIRGNWDGDSDPEDKFNDVIETLILIEKLGSSEEKEKSSDFLIRIRVAVSEMEADREPATVYDNLEVGDVSTNSSKNIRSIFDDVDE
jgi:hypothetical protein